MNIVVVSLEGGLSIALNIVSFDVEYDSDSSTVIVESQLHISIECRIQLRFQRL